MSEVRTTTLRNAAARLAGAALLCLVWLGAAPAPQPAELDGPSPAFPLAEAYRGQRGYGYTVFAGSEPERFEVEVLGVMRNLSPEVSYILARLTGHGLEQIGIAAGMSGSPVYLDGRLAGAVAFSWPFSHEAIAGITPIDSMRRLATMKDRPERAPAPASVSVADIVSHRLPDDLLERELRRLAPHGLGGAVPAFQWTAAGWSPGVQGLFGRTLGVLAPSGRAAPGSVPDTLVPGSAVSIVLADGDFQLAAHGTVTDRIGDQVFAFGHPFLGLGPLRVPMATSEVVTVLSSANNSFKISNSGRIVGAFEQDRLTGIYGKIGAEAPMIPMTLKVTSAETREAQEFSVRLAELPEFLPLLVGTSVLNGLDSASRSGGAQGVDLSARLDLEGYGVLEVRQTFDGDNAGTQVATHLLGVVAFLVQNPIERARLRKVEVQVEQFSSPRFAAVVGAHADRTVVRPGDRVNVSLDLAAFRGERFRRSLAVDLPEDLPAGRYSLLVGDGASVDAARLAIEPATPVSMHQALEVLRANHSRREIVALGVYAGTGLSVGGEVMPRLPGSVRSLWSAAASGSAVALRSTVAQQVAVPSPVPLLGMVRLDLEVRRKAPVAASSEPNGAAKPPTAAPPVPPTPSPPATHVKGKP